MSNKNEIFTGSVDELLEHTTVNQDELVDQAQKAEEANLQALQTLLDSLVEDGLLREEKINGETFYQSLDNNEEI
jgi:predicted transcriptional regulator